MIERNVSHIHWRDVVSTIVYTLNKVQIRGGTSIFLVYSTKSKAYKCFNLWTRKIVESINVKIDEKFQIQEKVIEHTPKVVEIETVQIF